MLGYSRLKSFLGVMPFKFIHEVTFLTLFLAIFLDNLVRLIE